MLRKIVRIDEERCDGCGQCIPACAEGAIALVGGKARLSADVLCDGLGACLGECPRGAITVIEREAEAFDEGAVSAHLARRGSAPPVHAPAPTARPPSPAGRPRLAVVSDPAPEPGGGCPGSRPRTLPGRTLSVVPGGPSAPGAAAASRLGHWPVQLQLVPPAAPYLQGADLLVAADCVPFAYPRFHEDLLAGRAVVIACPKLDDNGLNARKLGEILSRSDVRSVTVVRMEVPCCGGISMAARQGLAASGKDLPLRDVVIGVDGALRGPAGS
ncbi:MAG TPA: 4Fe-4S binding protein [Anaeromyxobacter sp.]|nr:4Fe-4S binding protein [Anaeromyxobacter sp.]